MMSVPNGKVYMDFNATTPLALQVVNDISDALTNAWANPSSSSELGRQAKKLINESRTKIAAMLGAQASDILFTSGGTEGNHLVLHSAIQYFADMVKEKGEKPHIITTNVEHDAILLPLKHYESKGLAVVDYVSVSMETGKVDPKNVLAAINSNTCLITIMLANNETGVIMPVLEVASVLREINLDRQQHGLCKIYLHTDAAQAIGKIAVNVDSLGVDYLTVVGHKFYGPRNGALYVRGLSNKHTPLYPMFFGGGQENHYRPGTENTPMILGLGTAAELITLNLESYNKTMRKMRDLLEEMLSKEFGNRLKFNCNVVDRLPNTSSVSFSVADITGADILALCPDLLASTGAACHGTLKPSAILLASGVTLEEARTTIRLSVGRETTESDVHRSVEMLKNALLI